MRLYLMRHTDAEQSHGHDFDRRLSEEGKKQADKMGQWLKILDKGPLRFVTSPYPRAAETAEIVAAACGSEPPQTDERLASGMSVDEASALVHDFGGESVRLCLVGHAPDLDHLAAWIVGAGTTNIEMKKGAIAAFSCERPGSGGSTLKWLINPSL